MRRYYHQDPYGSVGNIMLEQGVPARYVAVFCAHNHGLTLAEVKIYTTSKFRLLCAVVQYYQSYFFVSEMPFLVEIGIHDCKAIQRNLIEAKTYTNSL